MAARGMSYRMLAVRAGVDHSTIQRLVMGDRLPSLATAVAIIRVFQQTGSLDQPALVHADSRDAVDAASAGGAS
jgi:DNA-binding XRE family transcriptional regulator